MICIVFLMIALIVPSYAGVVYTPEEIKRFKEDPKSFERFSGDSEEPYIYLWSEEDMSYKLYENPNYQKSFEYVPPKSKSGISTLSVEPELGITPARQSYTVYSRASTSDPIGSIGSSKSREIVRVNSEITVSGEKWYNITYRTATSYKTGYIQAKYINIPSRTYSYARPCTTGTFTRDFGYNGHAGVDIGGTFSVYAITSGTVNFKHTKFQHLSVSAQYLGALTSKNRPNLSVMSGFAYRY